MKIAIVVAMTEDRVIGRDGDLPWRIRDDLKWFKKVTMGKPVIMGRKTFDSIGKALPGRLNIVVSRSSASTLEAGAGYSDENVAVVGDLAAAFASAAAYAEANGVEEICVIGGGTIYQAVLERAERIYLTKVDADVAGDAYFPRLDLAAWRGERVGQVEKGPHNDHGCQFFILDRIEDDNRAT